METEELSLRDLMKWGGAAVVSIPLGTLESIISGCKGAPLPGGTFDGSPAAAPTQGQNFRREYQRADANGSAYSHQDAAL